MGAAGEEKFTKNRTCQKKWVFCLFPPFFPLVTNAFRQGMHGVGCLSGFEIVSVEPFLGKTGENSN